MEWIVVVAVVGGVALLLGQRRAFVSEHDARRHLAQGALIIDVRSREEFSRGAVRNAINIPLGELRETIASRVKDKSQVLLLHCLSGGRSAIARHQLRRLGYMNTFNLGSMSRAEHIAASQAA